MASNRQERELMRQRGAGTRQIKELEFQIVLPGIPGAPRSPLKPQRSGRPRKTPQAELVPRRSSRRTPKPTQLQSQTSSRRTPARGRKKKVEKTLTSEPATIEDHITVLNSARTQSDGEGVTTKKRKFSIQEDAEASGDLNNSGTKTNLETSQNIGEAQNENIQSNSTQAPVEEVQGRKGKKRKSIVQVSRKKLKTELHPNDHNIEMPTRAGSLGPTDAEPEVSAPPFDANVIEEPQNVAVLSNSESQESNQDLDQALGGKKDEQDLTLIPPKPQAQAKPKRKKRRSIGQAQKPRRKATEALKPKIPTQVSKKKNVGAGSGVRTVKPGALATTVYATEARSRGRPKKIEIAINTENDHDGIHNVRDDHSETRAPQARRRGRPKKQLAAISEESQADENDIEASEKSGTKDLSTNSRRGRPKRDAQSNKSLLDRNTTKEKAKRKPKAPTKTKPSAIRQPPKNTIPVTVYRLSSAQAPDEDEANIDSLANPPLFKNNSVNAVDVLSQVCREIISKSSDTVHRTIKQEPSKPQKAELERRREIIDMYGEELDNRLFQLTETLDNNIALSARIRRATKEEKTLKAELQALQHRREEISKHRAELDNARKKAESTQTLHSLLSAIQSAIHLNKQADLENPPATTTNLTPTTENLQLILKHVAGDLSSSGGGAAGISADVGIGGGIGGEGGTGGEGLLDRVKGFNGFLERVGGVL